MVVSSLLSQVAVVLCFSSTLENPVRPLLTIEPTPEYPRNSEGDLVVLRDGTLCLVYTRFFGGASDHSQAELAMRTSSDGGETWSEDRVLVRNEGQQNVMSVSLLRLPTDELLLFYLRKNSSGDCRAYVRRSNDEFKTLSEPILVTTETGYHVVNNDRVLQLSTGRLVVPAAYHPRVNEKHAPGAIPMIYYSDDGGRTWAKDVSALSPPAIPRPIFQEPGVVELQDSRLMMWMRTDQGSQYQCFSADHGLHWSEPEPGPLKSPLSPASIKRMPWSGDLLCVWNDHSGVHPFVPGKRTPLCVAVSEDDGRTWKTSRPIETDPDGWYCYTSITLLADQVLLSYCAGDKQVGGLNRLKVLSMDRAFFSE